MPTYDWTNAYFSLNGQIFTTDRIGIDLAAISVPQMQIQNAMSRTIYSGPKDGIPGKDLTGAMFQYGYISDMNFTGCTLVSASFIHCTAENTKFNGCDLRGASFANARLLRSDFTGALRDAGDPAIPGWNLVGGLLERKPEDECNLCPSTDDIRPCGACCDCCDHHVCESCDECHDSVCRHCSDCENCCNCDTCQDCHALQSCDDCQRCSSCCSCDAEDEDDEADNGAAWAFKPGSKFKCKRTVGIEWEFNRMVDLKDWRQKWRGGVHSDGSCGYEAVTAPVAGDHIENCLKDLGKVFEEKNATADERCGIHVHVDARDMKWADMYRFLWVYGKVEPLLYLLAGQHRAKVDRDRTSYCKPVGKEYLESLSEVDRKGAVLAVALGRSSASSPVAARKLLRSSRLHKKDGGRYRGVNIIPWLVGRAYKERKVTKEKSGKLRVTLSPKSDSTIEFRMHRNTLLTERVVGWAQLCAKLVDWCANASDKDAQNLPKSALRALCEVIAPECAPWILHRVKEWRKATKVNPRTKKRKFPRRISLSERGYVLKVAA